MKIELTINDLALIHDALWHVVCEQRENGIPYRGERKHEQMDLLQERIWKRYIKAATKKFGREEISFALGSHLGL